MDVYGEIRSILACTSPQEIYAKHPHVAAAARYCVESALAQALSEVEDGDPFTEVCQYLLTHPQIRSQEVSFTQVLALEEAFRVCLSPHHLKTKGGGGSYGVGYHTLIKVDETSCAINTSTGYGERLSAFCGEGPDPFNTALKIYLSKYPRSSIARLNRWLRQGKPANLFGIPDKEIFDRQDRAESLLLNRVAKEGDQILNEDKLYIGGQIFSPARTQHTETWLGDVIGFSGDLKTLNQSFLTRVKDYFNMYIEVQSKSAHVACNEI